MPDSRILGYTVGAQQRDEGKKSKRSEVGHKPGNAGKNDKCSKKNIYRPFHDPKI